MTPAEMFELRCLLQMKAEWDAARRQVAACGGKKHFPTYKLANEAAKRCIKRHASRTMAYRCEHCGKYHIGERTKRPGRYT